MRLRPGPGSAWDSWLLLAPFLVGLVVLVAGPTALTGVLALYEADLLGPARFLGLANFAELWDDEVFHASLRSSLVFAAGAVPLRLLGAVGLALLLHARFRGASTYRSIAYLPTVVPDVAFALAWLWILNPLYGPLNLALGALGLDGPSWLSDPWAARLGLVIIAGFTVGEGFLIAMAVRTEIPADLYELAALEGAGPWATLRRLTLPLLAPTLVLLLLRDTIYSFQASFVPALIVTNGGPPPYATTFVPLFVYRTGFQYLRFGYAAAATIVMLVVTLVLIAVQYAVLRRWRTARIA